MEAHQVGVKCTVETRKGSYESLFYGAFQYTDKFGSKPVAVVKLRAGNLGHVDLSAVHFDPAPYMIDKEGKRVYFED